MFTSKLIVEHNDWYQAPSVMRASRVLHSYMSVWANCQTSSIDSSVVMIILVAHCVHDLAIDHNLFKYQNNRWPNLIKQNDLGGAATY